MRITTIVPFVMILFGVCACEAQNSIYIARDQWTHFAGTASSGRYSSLQQINRDNVSRLKKVWEFDSGYDGYRANQFSPLMIDGLLYTYTRAGILTALDPATGDQNWEFRPDGAPHQPGQVADAVLRGACFWRHKTDPRESRLFYSYGHYLYSIAAKSGEQISSFGSNGRIDLNNPTGFNRETIAVDVRAPCTIFENLIIVGTSGLAPGHIRAFDVHSGEMQWIFHTIPEKGEPGHETWGETGSRYATGANSWAGMSIDPERGALYFSTGSPKPNFYGGDWPGRNRFANSVIALDALTGKLLWDFQEISHDIWDLDPPAAPNLVQVDFKGKRVDAVAQVSKIGHTILLDRDTGKLLYPAREISAPSSTVPGEQTYPTQRQFSFPEPFSKMAFTPDDVTNISPEARAYVEQSLERLRTGWFEPPSLEGTVYFGIFGGAEWGGAAFDPDSHFLYVNSNHLPWIVKLEKNDRAGESSVIQTAEIPAQMAEGEKLYARHCAACHGEQRHGQGYAPSLYGIANRSSREQVLQLLDAGGKFMPAFRETLSDSQRAAVTAYVLNAKGSHSETGDTYHPPYKTGASWTDAFNIFKDHEGYPASKPPWGTLNAIDLDTGKIVWRVPLGEYRALTQRDVPQTGTINVGGPTVTAGGLLFIAATVDEKFRAFDKDTGELLWETDLPYAGYATPATYEIGGRQYVVILASGGAPGGNSQAKTKSGDVLVAFALPETQ